MSLSHTLSKKLLAVFQMSEGRKTQVILLDERKLEILIQVSSS